MSLIIFQMIRVISSPSISTKGVFIRIFSAMVCLLYFIESGKYRILALCLVLPGIV